MKLNPDRHINKKKIRIVIMILLIIISSLALLYPTISTAWNQYRSSLLINNYIETLDHLTDDRLSKIAEAARDYNKTHRFNNITEVFDDAESELSDAYLQLLDPLDNGMMGYIDIPKINQKLIIYMITNNIQLPIMNIYLNII